MRISDWSSDVCSSDLWLPYLDTARAAPAWPQLRTWADLLAHDEVSREDFRYEHVAYDHPLWVVLSSGTTGLPKAIVHSHVGALLEHLKLLHFHLNLGPDSVMFFYSTTGWMMWNLLLAALVTGSAVVLYDGNPAHPRSEERRVGKEWIRPCRSRGAATPL